MNQPAGFRQLSPHTRTTKHSYRLYIKAIFYFSVVKSIKFSLHVLHVLHLFDIIPLVLEASMKLYYDKRLSDPTYYVQIGIRKGKKVTSKNISKIGKHSELLKEHHDPLAYARLVVRENDFML